MTREGDSTTILRGLVSDQAELHRLLMKVRDLSVTLTSVTVINPLDSGDHEPDPSGAHKAVGEDQDS